MWNVIENIAFSILHITILKLWILPHIVLVNIQVIYEILNSCGGKISIKDNYEGQIIPHNFYRIKPENVSRG